MEKCNFLSVHERLLYYSGLIVYKFRELGCKVKNLEGTFVVDSSFNVVNKVITRNATSGCSVLVHKTKFFENSVRYACCKLWNTLPIEIRNYLETKVNVCNRLNERIINERDNIYTS
jgi:hypothetical protein